MKGDLIMKTFEVRFNVNGKSAGSQIVTARDSAQAKRVAMGDLQGRPGYEGKRISITSVHEIK